MAGARHGAAHLVGRFAVGGQDGDNPRRVVVADVAQVARHAENEVVSRSVRGRAAQLLGQRLHEQLIGDALVVGRISRFRLLLLGGGRRGRFRLRDDGGCGFRRFGDARQPLFVDVQRVVVGHLVDAAAHVLHRGVRLEAHFVRKTPLRLFRAHALRQCHQHVRPPAHRFLHQQHFPSSRPLQLQGLGQYLRRVSFLVKVQHQARQWAQGVRLGPVAVTKPGAMGCPDGQVSFRRVVARLDASAQFGQPRLAAHFSPFFQRGGCHGRAVSPSYTSKCLIVIVIVHKNNKLSGCAVYLIDHR